MLEDEEVHEGEVIPPGQESQESPEDALAQVRNQLAASEAARIEAENRARTASGQVQNAHEVTIGAALKAEEASLNQARANYKKAREDGDIDKEQEAAENAALARSRIENLKAQQAQIAQRRAAPEPAQPDGPGPQAIAWINDHPEMATNPTYHRAAIDAHARAVRAGHAPESAGYFQSINAELAQKFGPNHGKGQPAMRETPETKTPQAAPKQQGPRASSFATPPGRGTPTNKGANSVNEIAAKLGVTPDQIREAAEMTGMPGKDPDARLAAYIAHQNAILAERGTSIQYGEGAVLR